MNTYRFTGQHASWQMRFPSDKEAFEYAVGITDGPDQPVERLVNDIWCVWDADNECWNALRA